MENLTTGEFLFECTPRDDASLSLFTSLPVSFVYGDINKYTDPLSPLNPRIMGQSPLLGTPTPPPSSAKKSIGRTLRQTGALDKPLPFLLPADSPQHRHRKGGIMWVDGAMAVDLSGG
jgi:hypothetical protein